MCTLTPSDMEMLGMFRMSLEDASHFVGLSPSAFEAYCHAVGIDDWEEASRRRREIRETTKRALGLVHDLCVAGRHRDFDVAVALRLVCKHVGQDRRDVGHAVAYARYFFDPRESQRTLLCLLHEHPDVVFVRGPCLLRTRHGVQQLVDAHPGQTFPMLPVVIARGYLELARAIVDVTPSRRLRDECVLLRSMPPLRYRGASWHPFLSVRDVPMLDNVAGHGDAHLVRALLEHGAVGCAPLHATMRCDIPEHAVTCASLLLDAGYDPNQVFDGKTPLHVLAPRLDRQWMAVAEVLARAGADINAQTENDRETPLMLLCRDESHDESDDDIDVAAVEAVDGLIDLGADVHRTDVDGRTALFPPSYDTWIDAAIRALIRRGADVNRVDAHGVTPLMACCRTLNGHGNAIGFDDATCIHALLEAGADVAAADSDGSTALHDAFGRDLIRLLCARGADVNRADRHGRTPLITLAMDCDNDPDDFVAAYGELCDLGADASAQDAHGYTAPMHVVGRRYVCNTEDEARVVWDALVERGVDFSLRTVDGHTIRDLARGVFSFVAELEE